MQNDDLLKAEISENKSSHKENSQKSILEAVELVRSLDNKQLEYIGSNFYSYDFSLSSYRKYTSQFNDDILSFSEFSKLAVFLKYLQDTLGNVNEDKKTFKLDLENFFKLNGFEVAESQQLTQHIYEIFWELYNSKLSVTNWYELAIIDSLMSFDGFTEIRPVFDNDNKISQLLPIAILRIALSRDFQSPQNFVFQMSYDELEELERKIAQMKERLGFIGKKIQDQKVLNFFTENEEK